MNKQNAMQDAHLQLSKSSTEEQLKQYFMGIVELNKSSEEFPINLDDIWPIGYTRKNDAVRTLRNEFLEGEDFIVRMLRNYLIFKDCAKMRSKTMKGWIFAAQKCAAKKIICKVLIIKFSSKLRSKTIKVLIFAPQK